jgi:DNA-directed RNA polymerase specialized sigma24 family protein
MPEPNMRIADEPAGLDEDEIKLALMGTEADRDEAFKALYANYIERLVGFVESKFPGLPSDLAVDAVVETFRALYDDVVAGTFDFDGSLKAFLFKVAKFKGIDELRKISCRTLGNADFFDIVGETLEGTEASKQWQHHLQTGEAAELAQQFRDFLLTLPQVQRQVAQVMADSFPDSVPEDELCEEIYRRTKKRPTVVQVKSAKREIRKKFKDYLNQ